MNPASLVDLDRRLDISVEWFAPSRHITPSGLFGNDLGGRMSDDSWFYIPAVSLNLPTEQGAWGLGLYGVSGMGVDYERSRTFLPRIFGLNFDRRTEYSVARLVGGYGHEFSSGWAVGAAMSVDYARFRTDMLTLSFWETRGDYEWDGAFGVGVTLGVYRKWDRFGFGAAYSSPHWTEKFDDYDDLLTKSLNVPQGFQVGVSYDITPDLEVVVDYKYINWSGVSQISDEPLEGGFGWEDQHALKAGATWKINDRWALRGGVSYAESPIDEEHVFANALFPAIVETHVTTGVSHAFSEDSALHVTYMHAFDKELTEDGHGDLFSILGRGTEISLEENSLTVEYSWRF
jgi:long-chain fatty acid transport protein